MSRARLPSMELLRGFEAAARHLSFTRAGAELHLTQSAVSRQVRSLEEELGTRLFDRRPRALVLTRAGEQYYREVARLLAQLLEATCRARRSRAEGEVRVTTTPTFASLWLIPRLAQFQRRHASIRVHVVAENVLRNLERDDFDVAIRYSPRASAAPGAARLFAEQLVPLCSPKLGRTLRRPADLARFVLIHFKDLEGYAPWLSWDTWFADAGVPVVEGRGALYFSHYEQAMRAAVGGQGVALGRLPVVDDLLRDGRLVAPLGAGHAVALQDKTYWLMTAERHRQRREVHAFAAWLRRNAYASARGQMRRPTNAAPVRGHGCTSSAET